MEQADLASVGEVRMEGEEIREEYCEITGPPGDAQPTAFPGVVLVSSGDEVPSVRISRAYVEEFGVVLSSGWAVDPVTDQYVWVGLAQPE